ncbi:putative ribonuclease H protein [Vitis vinifera]|uniref:Putative ribonuclease H protein n=1 Tax=Vitis vinifera TaxID=29760 RepID=A0A438KGK8_VITVI|nr:putative ribonuclease H protein [Vitis vinifera]
MGVRGSKEDKEKVIPSATDKALAEEAMRYDSGLRIEREMGYGSSHLILYSFDRTPVGEPFDHSGVLKESNEVGPGMDDKGCWDLVEFNKDPNWLGVEWNSERTELQEPEVRKRIDGKKAVGQETKIQPTSEGVVRSLGSGRFLDWRALDADGAAGGLLICWDKRSLEVVDWEEGQYSLSCRFKNVEDGAVWGVYGSLWPIHQEEREGLWEELGAVRGIWDEPWCLGDKFSGVIQRRLPCLVSDHFPILLEGGGLRRGPSPFRGTTSYRLAAKTKELKQKLKVWNREVFGNLEDVREGIANAYHQRLSEDVGWKADIEGIQLDQISQQEAESLEIPFSENEIHSALMEMSGDKALGPDGFSMAFLAKLLGFRERGGGAADLGDFRPISLLGRLYKLMAKVLANRLKRVLNKVVAPTQNAFVMGRQILDASLIANEVIDSWQKRKEKGLICKLDIEKACISTAKFSVLVNGVPVGFFPSSKGLRCSIKGDRSHNLKISHLFFADDTIVFCEANKEHLTHLSWILLWFEAASGLRINLDKSEIIPVGAPNKASSVWDGVEEKVRRRLARWKRQYISKGGRITLIRSVLASMPIYHMSLFRMPKSVARRLDKVQRDFLWGGGSEERKAHLIKWEAICEDKSKGGLGLRKLVFLNKALLGKWIWRFAYDKDDLWKQVITAKYGQEGHGWRARGLMGLSHGGLEGNMEGN